MLNRTAHKVTNKWHLPTHLFVSPIWEVKTEHLALCKEKRWSQANNSTWGRILFVYGLGESTAQLVLEWLILMLGQTLFCLVFPVFKGRCLWITNRFLMGKYWMKKRQRKFGKGNVAIIHKKIVVEILLSIMFLSSSALIHLISVT